MKRIRGVARDWLPPALQRLVRERLSLALRFEGSYRSWAEAAGDAAGYDDDHILRSVLAATLKVKAGEAAYERDSVTFKDIEYRWPLLSALMWVAARCDGRLDVMDFGGSLGSSYFQHRRFFEGLKRVSWSIVEQPHFVASGNEQVAVDGLCFYPTIDSCLSEQDPDVVLFSSVLQYVESPIELLRQVTAQDFGFMILDRTPFSRETNHVITRQIVPESIYPGSYASWIFSESELNAELAASWDLIAELPCDEGEFRTRDGLRFSFRGCILERKG